MAEETENVESTLDDGVAPEVKDEPVVETEPVKTEEPKEGIINTIGSKIAGFFKGKEQETGEVIEPAATTGTDQEVDIPQEFYDVASKKFDDNSIMDFVLDENGKLKYTKEELLEMIPSLTEPVGDSDKSETPPEKTELEKEDKTEGEVNEIAELRKEIAELRKAQGLDSESIKQKEFNDFVKSATDVMDEASKTMPVLGTLETLPRFPDGTIVQSSPQMKAREEIFDIAQKLKASGLDGKTATQIALNAYKGKNLETDVKRSVIKSLKDNKKRLSPKQSGHEKTEFKTQGPDVITEIGRKYGVEIN